MPVLISNCSDTNALAGAFSKAQKYVADNNFKLQKSKDDILKMMKAATTQKPPDRPEVRFEDMGKTITATVGKNKKTVLVIATKVQSAADPRPALKEIEALLKDVDGKVGAQIQLLTKKSTTIEHFMNVGQEGCNALYVLIKEMQNKGTKGDKIGAFKSNPNVGTFMKAISENGASAEASIKEWDNLAKQAGQFQGVIGLVENRMKTISALLIKPEHVNEAKAVEQALAKMKSGLMEFVAMDIPRGTGFLKIDDGTAVGDIEGKASMGFKNTLKALEERTKKGEETARTFRQQHTGDALKHIQALAQKF
jgi:hypothetical protein